MFSFRPMVSCEQLAQLLPIFSAQQGHSSFSVHGGKNSIDTVPCIKKINLSPL